MNETFSNSSLLSPLPCVLGGNASTNADVACSSGNDSNSDNNYLQLAFVYAGLFLLAILGYFIALFLDRILRWLGVPYLTPFTSRTSGSNLSKATPVGLTNEERRQILQHMMLPTKYMESDEMLLGRSNGESMPNDDAEAIIAGPHSEKRESDIEEAILANVDAAVINSDESFSCLEASNSDLEDGSCSICLSRYQPGAEMLRSKHCVHMFHYHCCMEWLEKKSVCPYCRTAMFTSEELRAAALKALGPERTEELGLSVKLELLETQGEESNSEATQ